MEKRFVSASSGNMHIVVDVPIEEFNDMGYEDRLTHCLVRINSGGMISATLARTWADTIAEQLNQFDVANAAVAKLT